jgi:phage/plasmid primase-like uncharacterized protein
MNVATKKSSLAARSAEANPERVRSALSVLNPDDRDVWIRAGICVKSEMGEDGFDLWDAWGSQSTSHSASPAKSAWKSFKADGKLTIASLFYDAKAAGWKDTTTYKKPTKADIEARKAASAARAAKAEAEDAARHEAASARAQAIWDAATPAIDHPYLQRKGVQAHGLRVGKWERIDPETGEFITTTENGLLLPLRDRARKLWSLQCIDPDPEQKKLYLKDGAKQGHFHAIGTKPLERDGKKAFVLVEGYATGASVHECTSHMVLVCFDTSNLMPVALALRERLPDAVIIFGADNDTETKGNPGMTAATKAALEVGGLVAVPPRGDFNDLYQIEGAQGVARIINFAVVPSAASPTDTSNAVAATHKGQDDDDLGVIPLGRTGNKLVFWRSDFAIIEILGSSELGRLQGLQRLAPQQRWEMWASGDFKIPMASNFLINECARIGDVKLQLVPQQQAPGHVVREEYLKACLRSGALSGVSVIAELLLLQPEWRDVLYFDQFACRPSFSRRPPMGGESGFATDDHALLLSGYLSDVFSFEVGSLRAHDVITFLSTQNKRHPLREYLSQLMWDNEPRLDSWLIDYAGCSDSQYVRAVAAKTLIGAVARAFEPGAKVDTALVLEGPQGARKSSLFMVLVPDKAWFAEDLGGPIGNKDAQQGLAGKWIIELAELACLKKTTVDDVKTFLTRTSDNFRQSYGRRNEDHPRQCIFVGTVNPDADGRWLQDTTGGRRFWPVRVLKCNVEGVEAVRDQLWAEAVHRFDNGEPHWLSPDEEVAATREQSARLESNPWDDHLTRFFRTSSAKHVTTGDVFYYVKESYPTKKDSAELRSIAQALKAQGWTQVREGEGRTRHWVWSGVHDPDEPPI